MGEVDTWLYPGPAVVAGLIGTVREVVLWDDAPAQRRKHRLESRREYYRRNAKRLAASALRRMRRLAENRRAL